MSLFTVWMIRIYTIDFANAEAGRMTFMVCRGTNASDRALEEKS